VNSRRHLPFPFILSLRLRPGGRSPSYGLPEPSSTPPFRQQRRLASLLLTIPYLSYLLTSNVLAPAVTSPPPVRWAEIRHFIKPFSGKSPSPCPFLFFSNERTWPYLGCRLELLFGFSPPRPPSRPMNVSWHRGIFLHSRVFPFFFLVPDLANPRPPFTTARSPKTQSRPPPVIPFTFPDSVPQIVKPFSRSRIRPAPSPPFNVTFFAAKPPYLHVTPEKYSEKILSPSR